MTPEQKKRRAQMLDAHYNEQETHDTHDYRSPREWNKQVFRLEVKRTLFHLALNIIITAALIGGLYLMFFKK